ncbi:TetR family transcriptional regulator [Mycolicibacterium agri]|uniref:TetR family transcriptional regulator n=1 Tax=Mycolicibacterium agri TaxID=36811 RepID=A0A7I9W124_MYCAG|nr:TetR family transcriptional regulator [Mycolicibacterium agri]
MARVSDRPREQLVEAGIRILERDGLPALSARKLAAETGTSTMAVYTHFGGMTGLIDAIASEAFARFTRALTDIEQTDDPVADFFVMGLRYREFALANPQRYQMMFGTSAQSLNRFHSDLTVTGSASAREEWAVSFEALLEAVRRMIAAGRIRDDGVAAMAGRLWSINHGAVLLEMAGFFGQEGHGLTQILGPLAVDTIVGMGDERERTQQSRAAALAVVFGD